MNREQVKEILTNCRAEPKTVEDCAVCPLFGVHVNCRARMADMALEVIEADEKALKTLAEFIKHIAKLGNIAATAIDDAYKKNGIE